MSYSYSPLQPVLVEDPVNKVDTVHAYSVLRSGSKVSWKTYTSTSISASSMQFSCPPPSSNIIVDRNVKMQLPVRLTMAGTITTSNGSFVPGCTLLNAGFDAPRAFPLSSALDTLQVSLNNDAISVNMSDMIQALTRYDIGPSLRSREYSQSPNYADQSSDYGSLVGTERNPLGPYANGSIDAPCPRGGFPFQIVSNPIVTASTGGAAATAVVDMVITEPLFLSPFYFGSARGDNQGFFNLNAMDLNFNFLSGAGMRMWSHARDAPIATSGAITVTSDITSISIQFNGFTSPAFSYNQSSPLMLFKYYTPNVLTPLDQRIPYSYGYFEWQRYPTDIGTLAYSADTSAGSQFNSNNIQLNQIPNRMYIYARPSNSVLQTRCDITDTYLAMQQLSIQFSNQNTILSTANQAQLFDINIKNHSEQSWQEWSGLGLQNSAFLGTSGNARYCGGCGPLCLEFGTDIQLDPDTAPGLAGQFQLQITATLANKNVSGLWDNLPMTLYLVIINEGVWTVTSQASAQHQLGVLSKLDILEAQKQPGINYRTMQSMEGGDFFSTLSNFGSKINDFLKQSKIISTVAKVASAIPHPAISAVGNAVSGVSGALGYGYQGGCDGGIALGGGRRKMRR